MEKEMTADRQNPAGFDVPGPVILIIDDDPHNLAIVSEYLEECSYTILIAEDGKSGLKRADYTQPDLILLDVMMPGIDGYETCRRLKGMESTRDIPVIFMTALAETEHKVRGFEVGGVDYVTKPFQREEILARVGVHLRIRELTSSLQKANESLEKRVEERTVELRNSERRLADIINLLPDATFAINLAGEIILWNRTAEEITGVRAGEMLGKGNHEYSIPFYGVRRPLLIDLVLKPSAEIEKLYPYFRRDDGKVIGENYTRSMKHGETYMLAIAAPLYDSEGVITGAIESVRDITERKRAEAALRESEQKYRVLVANADEGIFVAQDGVVKFPNPKVLEVTGYSTEELASIPFIDLIHPEDRGMVLERHTARLRGGITPETYPLRVMNRAGEQIWVQLTAVLIDWEGEPGVLCFLRDITKERNLEAQFLQAQKMEAVGRLAGGIAHDFNNLLTVTTGYCDLALARIGALDPLRTELSEIRKASDRCAALTRQLLAFSRKQILVPKVINLNNIVADMGKMLRRLIGEDIDLVSVRGEDLWNVKADPGQIEQAIVNLAVNSRDAMPRGGKLTIETSNLVLDETYACGHKYVLPGFYVMLAVSDTGSGMDVGTVEKIFDPFFTTKEKGKGTGLGLSTVYGIVKQSGGHINVYSEQGVGTSFKLYFPRVEEPVTGISRADVLPPEELQGSETILLVEDEELVRQMVREILVRYGYTVLEARCGSEAIDLCSRHRGTIHLMLTDVVMLGLSGVELSKQLEPMHPEMKVLFMSGYTANAIAHQGILEPGIAFIHKPFSMATLGQKVREVLGSGSATS